MGLKDWIAGKVAGPQSYGDVMGRHAREHGSALGNVVFLSPELLTQESIKMSAFCVKMPPEWSSAGAIVNLERRFSFG